MLLSGRAVAFTFAQTAFNLSYACFCFSCEIATTPFYRGAPCVPPDAWQAFGRGRGPGQSPAARHA